MKFFKQGDISLGINYKRISKQFDSLLYLSDNMYIQLSIKVLYNFFENPEKMYFISMIVIRIAHLFEH
jgi:hypothetical protein